MNIITRLRRGWRDFRAPADVYVDKFVYTTICSLGIANGHDILNEAWNGKQHLATFRCTPVTIYRSLRRLEDAGAICRSTSSGQREYWAAGSR